MGIEGRWMKKYVFAVCYIQGTIRRRWIALYSVNARECAEYVRRKYPGSKVLAVYKKQQEWKWR